MRKITRLLCLILILIGANMLDAYSSVTITIRLARHRDCKGFGWCDGKIVIEKDLEPDGNLGIAEAEINEEGKLILTINAKTGLTPEAYETYFSSGVFIVEDDFPVPGDILEALNFNDSYTVKAGKYLIKTDEEKIILEF